MGTFCGTHVCTAFVKGGKLENFITIHLYIRDLCYQTDLSSLTAIQQFSNFT